VQGISAVQFGGDFKTPVNHNPLDLQQAFIDYTFGDPTPDGDRMTIRGGRFSMSYGSGRLIATRAAPNTPLKFEGLQIIGSSRGTSKLYAFATRPVEEIQYKADRADEQRFFYGLYASKAISPHLGIDLYYLGFKDEAAEYVDASGTERRHTLGMRFFGEWEGWDYNIEPVYQFGHIHQKDIKAWTIATDFGYTLEAKWSPRLGLKFDVASGDKDAGDKKLGSFNPLFFKAAYFNDAALLRPVNIIDLHMSLQLHPTQTLTATFGSDAVWRHSKQDGIYSSNGSISLPAISGPSYVGTTAEAALQWEASRHSNFTISYVHMFTGRYVDEAGGGDIDFLGTWYSYLW
jgi:hypothetical protein